MASKNDTPALLGALLITLALLGGGAWFLYRQTGVFGGGAATDPVNTPPALDADDGATPNPSEGNAATASTLAAVSAVPTGLFNYGGSTTWAPIRGQVDGQIQQVWPAFTLRYVNPATGIAGSSTGIEMLINGQLAFAQSSRPLRPEEYQQAQQRGFTLTQIPVALEGIAVAVNPTLNLDRLTLGQLRQIYTGQVTNWAQVGGPDVPIQPISRSLESGGTVEFFVDNVLGGQPLGNTVQIVGSTTQALRQLAEAPGGIYYASAPEVVPQCTVKPIALSGNNGAPVFPYTGAYVPESACPAQRNQINAAALRSGEYPITRQLFVIVKQNNQMEQQAGEAYAQLLLTNEGQTLIEQAGFVRIR